MYNLQNGSIPIIESKREYLYVKRSDTCQSPARHIHFYPGAYIREMLELPAF